MLGFFHPESSTRLRSRNNFSLWKIPFRPGKTTIFINQSLPKNNMELPLDAQIPEDQFPL
jgi:hypothetical protein